MGGVVIIKRGDKPQLADVDGTVPGKVQLMSIKLVDGFTEGPEQMHTLITEGEYDKDPWTFALGLQRGLEKDWPDHEWAIVGNWRARYLRWVQQMKLTISGEYEPADYVDLFKED